MAAVSMETYSPPLTVDPAGSIQKHNGVSKGLLSRGLESAAVNV